MKRIALLFLLLVTINLQAQDVLEIRPTTSAYRYETGEVVGTFYTNWFIEMFWGNLPQGRTYQRQLSTNGIWSNAGDPFFIPVIPDAMASVVLDMHLLQPPGIPIYFYRLVQVNTPASPATMKIQMNLVMADQPEIKTWAGTKKKFRHRVTIPLDSRSRLSYTPITK